MLVKIKQQDGKEVSTAGLKYEFSEIDYWRFVVRTMSYLKEDSMKDNEIEAMAFILAGSPYWSYFRKPHSTKLMKHLNVKTHQSLVNIRKVLEPLKFIEYTGEVRGDYLPSPSLRKLQMYIKKLIQEKNLDEISITFPIKIVKDDEK